MSAKHWYRLTYRDTSDCTHVETTLVKRYSAEHAEIAFTESAGPDGWEVVAVKRLTPRDLQAIADARGFPLE